MQTQHSLTLQVMPLMKILPKRYRSEDCILVLQKRQLQPDPAFFLVCAAHLQALTAQGLGSPPRLCQTTWSAS